MVQPASWELPSRNLQADQGSDGQPNTYTSMSHQINQTYTQASELVSTDHLEPEVENVQELSDANLLDAEYLEEEDHDRNRTQQQHSQPTVEDHVEQNNDLADGHQDSDQELPDPNDYESWDAADIDDDMDVDVLKTSTGNVAALGNGSAAEDELRRRAFNDFMRVISSSGIDPTTAHSASGKDSQRTPSDSSSWAHNRDFSGSISNRTVSGGTSHGEGRIENRIEEASRLLTSDLVQDLEEHGPDTDDNSPSGNGRQEEPAASSSRMLTCDPPQNNKRTFDEADDDDEPLENAGAQSPSTSRMTKRTKHADQHEPIFDPGREVMDEEDEHVQLCPAEKRPSAFNLFDAVMHDPAVFLIFVTFLDYKSFVNLYSMSRYFNYLIDSHMRTYILTNAYANYGHAADIMPWQYYARLSMKDPLNKRSIQFPGQVRDVPSLRYLGMLNYRHGVVQKIIMWLQLEDHLLPPQSDTTILKIWHLLEYPYNKWRMMTLLDKRRWSDEDLILATYFFMKLDMRFNDPVDSEGELTLRKLLLHQRSLTPLYKILSGKVKLNDTKMLKLWIMTRYEPEVPVFGPVWGVPAQFIGHLSREGWMLGNMRLWRPDTLIMREGIRRELDIHKRYLDMILYGYMDNHGRPVDMPVDRVMAKHVSHKKRIGAHLNAVETAWDENRTAKIVHARKLERQARQDTIPATFAALAHGIPLTAHQKIILARAETKHREAAITELQAKAGTTQPLSPAAAAFKQDILTERRLHLAVSGQPTDPPLSAVEQSTITMNFILKDTANHPLDSPTKLHLVSAATAHLTHAVPSDQCLHPTIRFFLAAANIKLKLHANELVTPAEWDDFRALACDRVRGKLLAHADFDALADEEKILVLRGDVLKFFRDRVDAGAVLGPEEVDRVDVYVERLRAAEKVVLAKRMARAREEVDDDDDDDDESDEEENGKGDRERNAEGDIPAKNIGSTDKNIKSSRDDEDQDSDMSIDDERSSISSDHVVEASLTEASDYGGRASAMVVQGVIDQLAAKVKTGLQLTDKETGFIKEIRARQVALVKKEEAERYVF